MKQIKLFPFLFMLVSVSSMSHAQLNIGVKEYFNIPGPVLFDNKSYQLSWSSHPSPEFYKQEYLLKGDSLTSFKTMMLFDLLIGNLSVKQIAEAKIAELKTTTASNPLASYQTFSNPTTGEYMIDFVLTANAAGGKATIAERNVYRYTSFTGANGKKGVLLFGISNRSYGNDIAQFFAQLKTNRAVLVKQVTGFKIPAIKILP